MISASQALERIQEGNRRFVAGTPSNHTLATPERRRELLKGQAPFAAVLGCADSRVPVETIFDQGPGDLFVVRVAGNVATPATIGSLEYAAAHLGSRLVMVLGHSHCGAVQATLEEIARPTTDLSPHVRSIVDLIRPAVAALPDADGTNTVAQAVRENIASTAGTLLETSDILRGLAEQHGLLVVGAEYSFETGMVEVLWPETF